MSEQNTAVLKQPEQAEMPAVPAAAPVKKKNRRKKTGKIFLALVIAAALAVGGFLLWKYLIAKPDEKMGEILTDEVCYGSVINMVEGGGVAKAKSAATITLTANGTVNEVFVTEGQQVMEGDPLYTIRSTVAEQNVQLAEEQLAKLQEELAKLNSSVGDLTVRAPFAGKLMEVGEFYPGDPVAAGTKVATLVNDKTLKVSLYFSYAYENSISVGQKAQISIPAVMGAFEGKVEKINKVNFITPEGAKCFEVVFSMKNPGTLTEGMDATVSLTAADGTPIYPYANGQLKFYERRDIMTKSSGPLVKGGLLNYTDVESGAALLVLGDESIREEIAAKEDQIREAQEKLETERQNLNNFNAVAPISGTVTSCGLQVGEEVESGRAAISIADNTVMNVTIDVDEHYIGNLQTGMTIDLTDWDGNMYMGILDTVSLEPKSENGITSYPVSVRVDNPDGALRNGQTLNYSIVANQSLDCLVVPIICVRYMSDIDGNSVEVVYLKADTAPEQTVQLPEEVAKKIPEGFYPVPVEVGLQDNTSVEIKSGLSEGDVVFTNMVKEQADNFDDGAMAW